VTDSLTDAAGAPLSAAELAGLGAIDACTLANAIETFGTRLRNEGFMDQTVRCLLPALPPMIGYAATVTIRGSAPPTADRSYGDRTDWWEYILTVPQPRVVVIADSATRPGLGALIGAVHLNILRALGCVGVVTNGALRDLPAAAAAGFHYFAGGVTVSHAYVHIVDFGRPVQVGGLAVSSGTLLHGDLHGVQSIPLDIAPRIAPVAARLVAHDRTLIELTQTPGVSLEQLREAVKQQP
jgi:4-hydroxy-4-methyl-2-oxoglutarate aldolase